MVANDERFGVVGSHFNYFWGNYGFDLYRHGHCLGVDHRILDRLEMARKYHIDRYYDFIEIMLGNGSTIQEIANKCDLNYYVAYEYMKKKGLLKKYKRKLRSRKPPLKLLEPRKAWPPSVRLIQKTEVGE